MSIRFPMPLLSLSLAAIFSTGAQARAFSGIGGHASHTCKAGEAISVDGTNQSITLTGACGALSVDGANNTVSVQQVESVASNGVTNTITYGSNAKGGKPSIAVSGVSSAVKQDKSLMVVRAAAAPSPAEATAPPQANSQSAAAAAISSVDTCAATQTIEGVSNGQSLECAAGDRLLFSGVSIQATVTGNCAAICIDGANNTINVAGDALAIVISGVSNTVKANRVDAVNIDGMSNKISWATSAHKNGPKLKSDGINNGASRRK
jgi:hypothetical protein